MSDLGEAVSFRDAYFVEVCCLHEARDELCEALFGLKFASDGAEFLFSMSFIQFFEASAW